MERKLIKYLPYVVREYKEFQAITAAEQPEVEQAWDASDAVLSNLFVQTAGDLGLGRWEKILGIVPKGTDTLEDRRFRVLSRLNEELPYTLIQLKRILESLCGAGNYTASVSDYTLHVGVGVAAKKNYADVQTLLERVTPVNLILDLRQLFNTHAELQQWTHAQLAWYSHQEVREDDLRAHKCTPYRSLRSVTHAQLSGRENKSIRRDAK